MIDVDKFIFRQDFNREEYIIAAYQLESISNLNLYEVAKAIALGQSIGNPEIRSVYETEELFERASVKINADPAELKKQKKGLVKFSFPLVNLDIKEDGISQLLCHLMGGHLDIDAIRQCRLLEIEFPKKFLDAYKGPKFGIPGIRDFTNAKDRPILGGIIKPKVGLTKERLLDIVKELLDGGADFIKEDEIMSNPAICPFEQRVEYIMRYINNYPRKVVYAVCINSDYPFFLERAKKVCALGGNCVHLNVWGGLSAYRALRELDLPLMLFFQKSGDRIFTSERHDFYVHWNVVCNLARLMGVDFIQAGMWGGYSHNEEFALREVLNVLTGKNSVFKPVLPSLSCGMHPGLVNAIINKFGRDVMLNVGGAIHGHPFGSRAGTTAMRQAIDISVEGKFNRENFLKYPELNEAIKKWGYIE
jgi:ribulose 1,5-bisphosphate carboxylase large subunit-like protein